MVACFAAVASVSGDDGFNDRIGRIDFKIHRFGWICGELRI